MLAINDDAVTQRPKRCSCCPRDCPQQSPHLSCHGCHQRRQHPRGGRDAQQVCRTAVQVQCTRASAAGARPAPPTARSAESTRCTSRRAPASCACSRRPGALVLAFSTGRKPCWWVCIRPNMIDVPTVRQCQICVATCRTCCCPTAVGCCVPLQFDRTDTHFWS
jgi:hypothetical protein